MKVLYIGKVVFGNTCYSRYRGYVRLGFNVDFINVEDFRKSNSLFVLHMKIFKKLPSNVAALLTKIEVLNTALEAQSAKNKKVQDSFEFS